MKFYLTEITLNNIPQPVNPPTGSAKVFIDSADGKAKVLKSDGTLVDLESGGGGGSSQWTTTGSDIYYTGGKVWVGTSSGASFFEVIPADNSANPFLVTAFQADPTINIIPAMTSATTPSGVVSCSGEDAGPAWKAFDHNATPGNSTAASTWVTTFTNPTTLTYQFATGHVVVKYKITANTWAPKDWTFEGSNDGASWTTLDTQTNQTSWGSGVEYPFTNTTAYSYYRISITDLANAPSAHVGIDELELFESAATATDALLVDLSGHVGINTATNGGQLHIKSNAASTKTLVLESFSGQTADLIDVDGKITVDAAGNILGQTAEFIAPSSTDVPLTIVAASSQSANLLSLQDSSLTEIAAIWSNGVFASTQFVTLGDNGRVELPCKDGYVLVANGNGMSAGTGIMSIANFTTNCTFRTDLTVGESNGNLTVNGHSHLNNYTASEVPLIVKGAGTQSANLLELQDSGSSPLLVFAPTTRLGVGVSAPITTAEVVPVDNSTDVLRIAAYQADPNSNIVPSMTGYTTPSGIASASSDNIFGAGGYAWTAFDYVTARGYNGPGWRASGASPQWLQYEFPTAKAVFKYKITAANYNQPTDWTFEGSNDGFTTTTVLDTVSGHTSWASEQTFTFSNTTPYLQYRLNVSAVQLAVGGGGAALDYLKLYETSAVATTALLVDKDGHTGLNTDTNGGQLHIKSNAATTKTLVLESFLGQTADLVDIDGKIVIDASGNIITPTSIIAPTSTDIPLTIVGASSQSVSLQEWQNSSNTMLAKITSIGEMQVVGSVKTSSHPTYGTGAFDAEGGSSRISLHSAGYPYFAIKRDDDTAGANTKKNDFIVYRYPSSLSYAETEAMRIALVDGMVTIANNLSIPSPTVPSTATSTGTAGQIAWDSSYFYVCTATNTWVRTALSTW